MPGKQNDGHERARAGDFFGIREQRLGILYDSGGRKQAVGGAVFCQSVFDAVAIIGDADRIGAFARLNLIHVAERRSFNQVLRDTFGDGNVLDCKVARRIVQAVLRREPMAVNRFGVERDNALLIGNILIANGFIGRQLDGGNGVGKSLRLVDGYFRF